MRRATGAPSSRGLSIPKLLEPYSSVFGSIFLYCRRLRSAHTFLFLHCEHTRLPHSTKVFPRVEGSCAPAEKCQPNFEHIALEMVRPRFDWGGRSHASPSMGATSRSTGWIQFQEKVEVERNLR